MKYLVTVATLALSVSAFAGHHEGDHAKKWEEKFDKMSFTDAKGMMQEMTQQKTALINDFKSCVDSAKDKSALRSCKKTMWEDKMDLKKDMKDKYKQSEEEDFSDSKSEEASLDDSI
jgi:hypothetical protein